MQTQPFVNLKDRILANCSRVIVGKNDIIEQIVVCLIASGHILLEDVPGTGKTMLLRAFAKSIGGDFRRIQFTPDLMPSDLTGINFFNQKKGEFEFRPGPLFAQVILADEINRATPRSQSALLEVMEEKRITIEGRSYDLPSPYIVMATQNPTGSVGTQMLPESQLDRFMIRIKMGYPSRAAEIDILKNKDQKGTDNVHEVSKSSDMELLQKIVANIYVDDRLYDYMIRLSDATRQHHMINLGLSPRGTISLCAMSKAHALMDGRSYVIPDDVGAVFGDIASHRMIIKSKAALSGFTGEKLSQEILESVPLPNIRG